MSKLKHTPGTWKYERTLINTISIFIDGSYAEPICEVFNYHGKINEIDKANARLISAAPEMLELLIKLLSNPTKNQSEIDELIYDAHCRGRELIEKATGLKIDEVLNEN